MIELHFEEAGDITLRESGFGPFATWFDTIARGSASDASQNLAIDCAVTPGAEALAALFEDFAALPEQLAGEILARVGTPGGAAGEGYPMVRLVKAREAFSATSGATTVDAGGVSGIPVELLDTCERVSRRAVFFETPGGLLAFRPPSRAAMSAYVDEVAAFAAKKGDASYLGAGRTLMLACAIVPDATALAAQIEAFPALAQWIPSALQELASGGKVQPRS